MQSNHVYVPCTLFEIDEWEETCIRKRKQAGPSYGPETCYRIPGRFTSSFVLWFQPLEGPSSFIVLNQSETLLLEDNHHHVKNVEHRQVSQNELKRLNQSIGSYNNEILTRDDDREEMSTLFGEYYLSYAETCLIVDLKGGSFIFVLNQAEKDIMQTYNPEYFNSLTTNLLHNSGVNHHSTTTSSTTIMSTNSQQREDFFMKSALNLLEKNELNQIKETEIYRKLYRSFPATNELMIFGPLRKRNKKLGWKERFVAVAPGKMFYVSSSSTNNINGSSGNQLNASSSINNNSSTSTTPLLPTSGPITAISKEEAAITPKIISLIPGKTWCRPSTTADQALWTNIQQTSNRQETIFEVLIEYQKGEVEKFIWACESREERDKWIKIIQAASSIPIESPISFTNLKVCNELKTKIQTVQDVSSYFAILRELESSQEIKLSVEWIQTEMNRPRGEIHATMKQAIADTERDRVLVNGKDILPCNVMSLLGELGKEITLAAPEEEYEDVLNFSRVILLATNRTQCGGLVYEATRLLLDASSNLQRFAIVPGDSMGNEKGKIPPIEITVEKVMNNNTSLSRTNSGGITQSSITTTTTTTTNEYVTTTTTSTLSEEIKTVDGKSIDTKFQHYMKRKQQHGRSMSFEFGRRFLSGSSSTSHQQQQQQQQQDISSRSTPTSPKGTSSFLSGFSTRTRKTIESEGLTQEISYQNQIKVKVLAKACMEFSLVDTESFGFNDSGEEDDSLIATIAATFTRSFCLVHGKSVALDQGLIHLKICNLSRKVILNGVEYGVGSGGISGEEEEDDGVDDASLVFRSSAESEEERRPLPSSSSQQDEDEL